MGKKIYFPAIMILFFSLNFVFAIDEVVYVDVAQANQTIETYKTENTELQTENDSLTAQNQENQKKIDDWNKAINEQLNPLRANVIKKASDIRALLASIVDENMKAEANDALTRGTELLKKLEIKKQMLDESIFKAQTTITENNNKIQRNKLKIQSNNQLIADLEDALKSTEQQSSTLNEYIGNVTNFIDNAEDLLDGVELPIN